MNKVKMLSGLIGGQHVMGENQLADYHAAREAIKSMLKSGKREATLGVKKSLRNHRVSVIEADDGVRVFCHEKREEYILPWSNRHHG